MWPPVNAPGILILFATPWILLGLFVAALVAVNLWFSLKKPKAPGHRFRDDKCECGHCISLPSRIPPINDRS